MKNSPSKIRPPVQDKDVKRRRIAITDPSVFYLDFLSKKYGYNKKETSKLISQAISYIYELHETDQSEFLSICGVNLCYRSGWEESRWCQFSNDIEQKFLRMSDTVVANCHFDSPASLVNHAIAYLFRDEPGGMSAYLDSVGIGKPGSK